MCMLKPEQSYREAIYIHIKTFSDVACFGVKVEV